MTHHDNAVTTENKPAEATATRLILDHRRQLAGIHRTHARIERLRDLLSLRRERAADLESEAAKALERCGAPLHLDGRIYTAFSAIEYGEVVHHLDIAADNAAYQKNLAVGTRNAPEVCP